MTVDKLGQKLKEMCHNAHKGEKVTMIYLFGITYHFEIKEVGIKQIIEQSGLHNSYTTELSKAIKLAKYVHVNRN